MSFSCRRRFPVRRPAVVDMGCSCRGKTLSSFFASLTFLKRKPKPYCAPVAPHQPLFSYHHSSSSSSSTATAATSPWETSHHPSSSLSTATTASSLRGEDPPSSSYLHSALPRKNKACDPAPLGGGGGKKAWVGDSVAVVKESQDPYVDFRESMLQMILEEEIYAWEDLLELLHSFLALNAPCHHDLILRAFSEIYSGMVSPSGPSSGAAAHITRGRRRRRGHHGGGGRRPRTAAVA